MFFNGSDVWRTWPSNVREFHSGYNNNNNNNNNHIRNSFLITSTDLHNINNIMYSECTRLSAYLFIHVCRFVMDYAVECKVCLYSYSALEMCSGRHASHSIVDVMILSGDSAKPYLALNYVYYYHNCDTNQKHSPCVCV